MFKRMPNPVHCLITAGPTREYFDPVRFISNPSSGQMGYALAEAALAQGWQVDLVTGPVALTPPTGAMVYPVVTGDEMLDAVVYQRLNFCRSFPGDINC